MGYEVTIHTAAEIAAYKRKVEEKGQPCGDMAEYRPAHRREGFFGGVDMPAVLYLTFPRPATNLCTQKEWIEMLACAVQSCRRKDSNGRGLTRAEFQQLVNRGTDANNSENGFSIPMARGLRRGIKPAELKALQKMLGW